MAKWLFKSEPDVYSFEQLQAKGKAGDEWTGIRNYGARNNMRLMKLGEQGFFYYFGKRVGGSISLNRSADLKNPGVFTSVKT